MSTLPPTRCDLLVVGAGPAGSACAQALARQGLQVLLVDAQVFPRDKACGDGLIPDAHAALRRLGVYDEVMAQACAVSHVRCLGPGGERLDVPGALAVLPRRQLDETLRQAALRAGAAFAAPWRLQAVLEDAGRVVGARLSGPDNAVCEVQCRWLVLATGAAVPPLQAAGMCLRRVPSGMALRGYFRHPGLAQRLRHLQITWHRQLAPGYGWVFPVGGGVFNVGAGVFDLHAQDSGAQRPAQKATNLRQLLQAYAGCDPDAGLLLREGTELGPVKGAPLRCGLAGARLARPGLLVIGEAAGSTYAFTGEGIGKAMETGLLAADALAMPAAVNGAAGDAAVCARYEAALAALKPRFDMYRRANIVNAHPWAAGFVIRRAQRSPRLLRRMAGVLDETSNPGSLFTARGVWKLLTE